MLNAFWWALLGVTTVTAISRPQGHNLMKLPSFRGIVEVRASLPGRMRLSIPAAAADPAGAEQMKAQLLSTGAVRSVLGIEPQQSVETFLGGLAGRYRAPEGPCKLQGAVFSLDSDTGLCVGVERVDVR